MNLLLFSASTLSIVFPIGILLIVLLGYFVFYMECQRYAAREKILHAVNRFALTSVVLVIVLAFVLNSQDGTDTRALAGLQAELATLKSQHTKLLARQAERNNQGENFLAANKRLRQDLEHAVNAYRELEDQTLAAVTISTNVNTSRVEELPIPALQEKHQEARIAVEPEVRTAIRRSFDFRAAHESLNQLREAHGRSINPAYQAHQEAKVEANKLIQQLLERLQHYDGAIDGDGQLTRDAVLAFQEANDLPATGIVAHQTVRQMLTTFEQSLVTVAVSHPH